MAVNRRLANPLDEFDPAFNYAVWTEADEQYDVWLRTAIFEMNERIVNETKPPFNCWLE